MSCPVAYDPREEGPVSMNLLILPIVIAVVLAIVLVVVLFLADRRR
jgi:hypothetical protein